MQINKNPDIFNGKEIEFPVDYELKVIMDATIPDEENKESVKRILDELNISQTTWTSRLSKEGKYISYSIMVKIVSKEVFEKLYKQLTSLPSVKWAL